MLEQNEIPSGLEYPQAYVALVERQLLNFEPWWLFEREMVRFYRNEIGKLYGRSLLPFAKRQSNDDVGVYRR